MKSKFRSMTAILVIAAMMVTCLPVLGGSFEASAASGLTSLKAKNTGMTTTTITWKNGLSKKQKKAIKGIAVFRNNKVVKRISKNSTSFKDSGLKAGTSYTYQLKTYKYKKVKVWYNKKTKKWQTKKPVKKYRGKSKKKNVAVYSNPSARKTVKTKSNAGTSIVPGENNGVIDETPKDEDGKPDASAKRTKVTPCVDYLGNSHNMWKDANGVYWDAATGGNKITTPAQYCKSIDGEWSGKYSRKYIQKNGVTFLLW